VPSGFRGCQKALSRVSAALVTGSSDASGASSTELALSQITSMTRRLGSWRTSRLGRIARRVVRATGFAGPLARLLNGPGYEAKYDSAFLELVRPADVVWDIGANVGHYTELFAARVGSGGTVVAFEPSPVNFKALQSRVGSLPNVRVLNCAIGSRDGTVNFVQGADALGATSRIAPSNAGGVGVEVRSGKSLLSTAELQAPHAVKIDVEGHEAEVLEGFGDILGNPTLRVIGVEVHFELLQREGRGDVPAAIERLLKQHGYAVAWADLSHVLATRS
jgi:FkbM family methyltransferase